MICLQAHLDAAYVLGALSPGEREAYAAHLPGCASCTKAVQELAGLPGLLALVDPVDLDPGMLEPAVAPPFLLPRLVREARGIERRRTWRAAGAAAAAALLIGAGGTWVVDANRDTGSPVAVPTTSITSSVRPTAVALVMTSVGQNVVTATVAAVPVAWGTRLDLTCTWADVPIPTGQGYSEGEGPAYTLVVRTKDGRTEQVASWQALPGKTMHLTGATASPTADITGVEVRNASGKVVLEVAT